MSGSPALRILLAAAVLATACKSEPPPKDPDAVRRRCADFLRRRPDRSAYRLEVLPGGAVRVELMDADFRVRETVLVRLKP